MVHAPYTMRRLPALCTNAGFNIKDIRSHGYVQTRSPDHLLSLSSRTLDAAVRAEDFGDALSDGFYCEAQRCVDNDTFYGAVLFMAVRAEKSGQL